MSTISEETILRIKSKMQIAEVVEEYLTLKQRGPDLIACCPFHNEKTPSFYVSPSRNIFKCFGCSKSGDAIAFLMENKMSFPEALRHLAAKYNIPIEEESKVFVKPEWKNNTALSDKVVSWFGSRKIRPETLTKMKVGEGKEFMPQFEAEVNTIQFHYFMDDELVNTKYRGPEKSFKMFKNAKLIFYGMETLAGKKEAIILEGEMDALSLIEAGLDADYGVLSVPNGAHLTSNNLAYVDNCIDKFDGIQKIIIGTDNDTAGRKLREELSERFGRDRCVFIEWKDKKDANDVLVTYGIEGIHECVNKRYNFQIEGTFTVSDFAYEIEDMYKNGLEKGVSIGLEDFSLRFVPGYLTTITGIPSHGKSNFVDELTMRLLRRHQWKGAYYSPENKPVQLHISKLARRLIGKNWDGDNRITQEEKQQVKDFLDKKVFFIKPEKDFSLQSILNHVRELKKKHGIKWFVIDAWNKLEHKAGKDIFYVGRCLDELTVFCELEKVHCFLVAHPTKMEKDKNKSSYMVPTLYNISGGADFYNKTDNGICVYRDFVKDEVHVHLQKIKFDHWGWVGKAVYKYDIPSMRYYPELKPETTNWITGEDIRPPAAQQEEKLFDESAVEPVVKTTQDPDKDPF